MANDIYNQEPWVDKFILKRDDDLCDRDRLRRLREMIPSDVKTVLEVGAGDGRILRELGKAGALKCFGVDVSMEAARRVKGAGVCVCDAGKIPFKDGEFDLILAADLLEHIKEESLGQTVSEITRVSKKYILINSPYKDIIAWPVSLCNACGREFNVYGHLRSIDMRLINRFFPKDKFDVLKRYTFGTKRNVKPLIFISLARRFGKAYSSEGVICPYCLNRSISAPARNAIEVFMGKVMYGALLLTDRMVPGNFKPWSELAMLLRRKS